MIPLLRLDDICMNNVRCNLQINPRISQSMLIKSALILSTVGASYYGAFFYFQNFLVRSLLAMPIRPRSASLVCQQLCDHIQQNSPVSILLSDVAFPNGNRETLQQVSDPVSVFLTDVAVPTAAVH